MSLTPVLEVAARIRCSNVTPHLNFSQRTCKGPCKARRSVGQFSHDPCICDRCYKRKPKDS